MPARKQEEALLVPTVEISSMKHSTLAIWLISALSSQNSLGQIWDKRALILKKGWTDLWQIQNGEVFSQKLVLHTWLGRIRIIIPFLLIAQVIFLSLLIGPFVLSLLGLYMRILRSWLVMFGIPAVGLICKMLITLPNAWKIGTVIILVLFFKRKEDSCHNFGDSK